MINYITQAHLCGVIALLALMSSAILLNGMDEQLFTIMLCGCNHLFKSTAGFASLLTNDAPDEIK